MHLNHLIRSTRNDMGCHYFITTKATEYALIHFVFVEEDTMYRQGRHKPQTHINVSLTPDHTGMIARASVVWATEHVNGYTALVAYRPIRGYTDGCVIYANLRTWTATAVSTTGAHRAGRLYRGQGRQFTRL